MGVLTATVLALAVPRAAHESHVRLAGLVLQLLGLATVAFGLRQTRKLFGRPSMRKTAALWLRNLRASFVRPTHQVITPGTAHMAFVANPAGVSVGRNPARTLEQKVAALEEEMDAVKQKLAKYRETLKESIDDLADQLQTESVQRHYGDSEIKEKLETMAVGGIHLEFVGLIWLFVGVICSGFPQEVAAWLN